MIFSLSGPHAARVVRVVDGDTLRCDIQAGTLMLGNEQLSVWTQDRPVRLSGCNAWESTTPAGKAAKAHLTGLLPPGTPLTLSGVSGYKYGADAELVASVSVNGVDLVSLLIADQWAAVYTGEGKAGDHLPPWPRTV